MKKRYRLGWPFGRFIAQLGCPVTIRVNVIHDQEANVFIGTSTDIAGFVVEAETLDLLRKESREVMLSLLEMNYKLVVPSDSTTQLRYNENLACA